MKNRTVNIFNQIKWSFIFKIIAFALYYMTISSQVKLLGIELYGIWSTLLSIVTWMVFFDFGIGNGIKNNLTKALSLNKLELAKDIIFTGYIIVAFISALFFIIILFLVKYADLNAIFNTDVLTNKNLQSIVIVLFTFVCVHFVLSFIKQFIFAIQKNSLNEIEQSLFFLMLFLALISFNGFFEKNILHIALIYGICLISSKIILTIYFFYTNKQLLPSFSNFNKKIIKQLTHVGFLFFALQIASMTILLSDRMIITQLLGAQYVTSYDIIYRIFSIVLVFHGIINAPMWSAYTEAYTKNDFDWIRKNIIKMNYFIFVLIFIVIMLYITHEYIINLWIGKDLENSNSLSFFMALYVIILSWCNNYAFFLNAINKIKIQFILLFIGAIVNIPLSILFVSYFDLGLSGVVLATTLSLLPFAIIGPIQTWFILKR
ncbi:TPA: lipopolysaccharide biosynthesis protein [Photobacterium damselae]